MGLLRVKGTIDVGQFWPKGASDADTAVILVGVQAKNGARSDDIHPGSSWTYRFRATGETVGV